jgi:hypothetical protein
VWPDEPARRADAAAPAPMADDAGASAGGRGFVWRWLRRLAILVVAIVAAAFYSFFTVDIGDVTIGGRSIRTLAEEQASKYLERPMRIGRVSAYVAPGRFRFDEVVIEGATPTAPAFFRAARIDVRVPWWTLFGGQMVVEVELDGWRMAIERTPDGQTKLPRFTPRNPSRGPSRFKTIVPFVYAKNGEFFYDDQRAPWSIVAPNLQFAIVRAANLETYVGTAEFTGGTVRIQDFEPMSADFRTRFQMQGRIVQLHHIDLLTDGAESHIGGYVNFGNWPEQEYRIQSTVDFERMRELFWARAGWRVSGEGRFAGIFKLSKETRDLSGEFSSDEAALGLGNTDWRFPDLRGALQWTPDTFAVTRAESGFLGGRMRLTYGLAGIGRPGGSIASFTTDYDDVDAYRFTRQVGWTAIEPQGRLHGHWQMGWPNGRFSEVIGSGSTVAHPPAGQPLAAPVLPASADSIPPEVPFQAFRPFGPFAVGADARYRLTGSSLEFEPSWVATPTTFVRFSGRARGGPAALAFHVTSHDWQNSDRMFTAIMSNFGRPTAAIPVGGRGTFDGTLTRSFENPRIEGRFDADNMRAWDVVWGRVGGRIVIENRYLHLTDGVVQHESGGRVLTSGTYSLGYPRADGREEIRATIHAEGMPLAPLRAAFGLNEWPVEGVLASADLSLDGMYTRPNGTGRMRIEQGNAWTEPFDSASADLEFDGDGSLRLRRMEIVKGPGVVTGLARVSWADNAYAFEVRSTNLPVDQIAGLRMPASPLSGTLGFTALGASSFDAPSWEFTGLVPDLYIGDEGIGVVRVGVSLANNLFTVNEVVATSEIANRLQVNCNGSIARNAESDAKLRCAFTRTSLDPYLKFVARELPYTRAIATGSISLAGPLADPTQLAVEARVDEAQLTLFDYDLSNDGPLLFSFRDNTVRLGTCGPLEAPPLCSRVRFTGTGTGLELDGSADMTTRTADLRATGQAALAVLQAFYPSLTAEGTATIGATLTGGFDNLELRGQAEIADGRLRHRDMPHGLSEINGPIRMEAGRITVDGLRGVMGDGNVRFGGDIALDGYRPVEYNLTADGQSLHLRFPDGLQSTVMANLYLRGPIAAPVLGGTVDVLRASYTLRFQPRIGYFSLLNAVTGDPAAASLAPEAASTVPLALAIKIRAPRMPFVDNKSASALIIGSGEMDVTGTIDQPRITGRLDLDRGEWVFSGHRYELRGGSVDFTDPYRFDPVFDMTAETEARSSGQSYRVTIRITGTLDKLDPVLSSEPWLPDWQILSLLLGETPDVGLAELRDRGSPEDLQAQALRTAGFAIITSPISATVGSAVQRVTTIDTVQIVPLLGNENLQLNPTARVILGKRLSNRVYLTYSRTLSGAQNEVILIEFDQNDQLSWVLSRNEDRSFALDFRLRFTFR